MIGAVWGHYLQLSLSAYNRDNSGEITLGNFLLPPLLHEYKEASIVEIGDGFAELMMAIMNGDDDCTVYY